MQVYAKNTKVLPHFADRSMPSFSPPQQQCITHVLSDF